MADVRLALCLTDGSNDFQQLLKAAAEQAAHRAGVTVETHVSGNDATAQFRSLRACLALTPPPRGLLVLAAPDRGLAHAAREALRAGVSFAFLNRTEDDVDALRHEAPAGTTAFTVCADEFETGRIQGRQMRARVPARGLALYVQGSTRNLAARDRTAGMLEAVRGAGFEVDRIEAGWTRAESHAAVRRWLEIVAPSGVRVDLVGAQNDQIALGAIDALGEVARESNRADLAGVAVCGCDGTPQTGQRLVREGVLATTVTLPRSSGAAVELLVRFLSGGSPPPALTLLAPTPFPPDGVPKAAPLPVA